MRNNQLHHFPFQMILVLVSSLLLHMQADAKPKIVVSINPVADIVSMLTENNADIVTINTSKGCPHHYQMKPSDSEKIVGANMLIYIDDNFDVAAKRLADKFDGATVKISDIGSINFLDENGAQNWHFWLNLDNVLSLQEELATLITKAIPELETVVMSNKNKARSKIEDLIQTKKRELTSLAQLVIVSDSLEHFFQGMDIDTVKLYQKTSFSLKDYARLERIFNTETPQCVVVDSSQNTGSYEKFNKKIIQIDSENWGEDGNTNNPFIAKYLKIISNLKNCTINQR
ncbi:MAG: zinc ABC transporter substrate-binding protein [Rickettsiaceae bacterium]